MRILNGVIIVLLVLIAPSKSANVAQFNCGRDLYMAYNKTTPFYSPSYEEIVEKEIDCIYTIETRTESKVVKIKFHYFNIKETADCNTKFLKILDGKLHENKVLSQKCGKDSPDVVISTKNVITLHYKVDSQAFGEGFEADIMQVDPPAEAECGSTSVNATKDEGIFKSSGQGNLIPYPIRCEYKITTTHPHMFLKLHFTKFAIDGPTTCDESFVKIYDGDAQGTPLKVKCGRDSPGDVQSTGQLMTVVYHAPRQSLNGGFQATLKQEVDCGPTQLQATDVTKTLKSAAFEADIPYDINCKYTITAKSSGKVVHLKFKKFKIAYYPDCDYGFVKIWDGEQTEKRPISWKCGQDSPGEVTSESGTLVVQYMVDSQSLGEGFTADYQEVSKDTLPKTECNQQFTINAGGSAIIDQYEAALHRGEQCLASIQTTSGYRLQLQFTEFKFKGDSGNCSDSDYLQIGDGLKSQPGAKRMCGNKPSDTYVSSGNEMFVNYIATHPTETKGFKAIVKSVSAAGWTKLSILLMTILATFSIIVV